MGAVEEMSFQELVETLAMFEQEHEPSTVDRAVQRSTVERRLLGILSAGNRAAAERRTSVRVPGDLAIKLYVSGQSVAATLRDIAEGGVGIRSLMAPPRGAAVEIELVHKKQGAGHPPRAHATVAWLEPVSDHGYDIGLCFIGHDDGHRRRMRRLVLELLRRLPTPPG